MGKITDYNVISKLYDQLCTLADTLIEAHNPCSIEDGFCNRYPKEVKGFNPYTKGNLCCKGCKHHSIETGCTVRSLACKLWICGDIWEKDKALVFQMEELAHISREIGIPDIIRGSREEVLKAFKEKLKDDYRSSNLGYICPNLLGAPLGRNITRMDKG